MAEHVAHGFDVRAAREADGRGGVAQQVRVEAQAAPAAKPGEGVADFALCPSLSCTCHEEQPIGAVGADGVEAFQRKRGGRRRCACARLCR